MKKIYTTDFDITSMEELYSKDFKRLSNKVLNDMTVEQKLEYYKNFACFLRTLDYDKDKIELDEKHFIKAGKIIIPTFDFLFRPQTINKKYEPKNDGIGDIYVCNHLGSLDHFSIISAIGKDKPLHILASDTLLNLKRGMLYKYVGCVFVNLKDIKNVFNVLDHISSIVLDGKDVLIFPEGTRNTTDESILEFQTGAILVSRITGARIIPLAVNENYNIFSKNLYVRYGDIFTDDLNDDVHVASKKLQEIVFSLMWENAELEKEKFGFADRNILVETQKRKKLKIEKEREKIKNA